MANKANFRFINHTFTHADMDKAPVPANAPCDYATFTTIAAIQAEITRNRTVWGLLGLPEKSENNRVLVSGNHSGLKDRKCTDDPALHPEMFNVQSDDVAFDQGGANPLFLQAAASAGRGLPCLRLIAAGPEHRAVYHPVRRWQPNGPGDAAALANQYFL